jgi:hypothetical protein
MATASGINKVVSYKKETSFGTLPSPTTGGQTLRRVSSNFNLTKETYQSEEIRTDYQLVDFRHGVRAVEGSISGELSAGTYADFLASALARNWTAATPSALGSTTIASVGGKYTITRTTGSWLTDAVRVGNVIRLTGFATANNNANLLVIALTATVATVVALNNVKLTAETVASGGTYTVAGKTTYAPTTGHTDDSYTFEEWYSDIGQSEVTVGNKVNTVGIALPATGLTTVDLSFMGQDLAKRGTSQFFTTPTAQNSNGIFAAVNGALIVNGAPVALVTGANFNINRNMTSEAVVGSNIKPEIYEGRIIVDGDFTTLYQDGTFAGYFDNETEISLVVALTANSLPNSEFMSFTIPRLKLSTDTKDDGEKGIVSSNSFQALKGFGANGFEATTLMIQDSTLV